MSGTRRVIAALAAAAALAIGGIAAVAGLSNSSDSPVSARSEADAAELTTAAGLDRLLDEIRQKFGDSEVDELDVHPGYARLERRVPGKPALAQAYTYEVDGGAAQFTESGVPSPRRPGGDPAVDLAPLRPNVPTLIGLFYGAERTLAVDGPTAAHISVKQNEHGPGAGIYLSNPDQGTRGYLTMGFDGEVLEVRRADR
ncbi:hypothetical protein [Prescottella subtropica]|uniref:hypothetical protein n=1 Tax=Prescottella subtropica TaxID=2545757 RepID=UPI0010F7957C|nr:hypothetical protein [Prescottella subtropica]